MQDRIFGLDLQLLVDAGIMAISIFVLFVGLSYFLFEPCRAFLKKRQDAIWQDFTQAEQQKLEAEQYRRDYEKKLANLKEEAKQLLQNARQQAEQQKQQLIQQAKQEAMQLQEEMKRQMQEEIAQNEQAMRQAVVTAACELAGEILKTKLDEKTESKLFTDMIQTVILTGGGKNK